eukprot:GHVS01107731.1.p1 GENE.GHVS01107731.1~~GHVS01107731.1.p1  ORF type:complete len:103 (-),score=14.44 GHVS01107731.1:74-382(-)
MLLLLTTWHAAAANNVACCCCKLRSGRCHARMTLSDPTANTSSPMVETSSISAAPIVVRIREYTLICRSNKTMLPSWNPHNTLSSSGATSMVTAGDGCSNTT